MPCVQRAPKRVRIPRAFPGEKEDVMSSKITSTPDLDGKTVTETENDAEHGECASADAMPCIKHPTDVQFSPGTRFRLGEIEVELIHCLSLDRMVVRERLTGETRVAVRAELRQIDKAADASPQLSIKPERVSEELLTQITARAQALQPYVSSGVLPSVDAHRIAKAFGVSSRTVRRWLRRYQRQGDVTAFIPAQRGMQPG
jgi:Helix-turn-helix domain